MVTKSMAHKKSGRAPALAVDLGAAASADLPPQSTSSKAGAKPLRVKVPKSKERALSVLPANLHEMTPPSR